MAKQFFDKEEVFTKQVLPVLEQLRDLCSDHDLPVLTVVSYGIEKQDEETNAHKIAVFAQGDSRYMPDSLVVLMALLREPAFFDKVMESLKPILAQYLMAQKVREAIEGRLN